MLKSLLKKREPSRDRGTGKCAYASLILKMLKRNRKMYKNTKIIHINSVRKTSLLQQWLSRVKHALRHYFLPPVFVEVKAYYMMIKNNRMVSHSLIKTTMLKQALLAANQPWKINVQENN